MPKRPRKDGSSDSARDGVNASSSGAIDPNQVDPNPVEVGDEAVAELLAGIRDLRLRLSTDLSVAASALEAEEAGVARDIVDADRAELLAFAGHMRERFGDGRGQDDLALRRVKRALPAAPVIVALAVTAAAAAVVVPTVAARPHQRPELVPATHHAIGVSAIPTSIVVSPASASLMKLQKALASHAPSRVVLADARVLHRQLAELIASSGSDPASISAIATLLTRERELITSQAPAAAAKILRASQQLVDNLLAVVSLPTVSAPSLLDLTVTTTTPSTTATATTPATPTDSSSPSPTTSTPSTQPTFPVGPTFQPPQTPTARPTNPFLYPVPPRHHHHRHASPSPTPSTSSTTSPGYSFWQLPILND